MHFFNNTTTEKCTHYDIIQTKRLLFKGCVLMIAPIKITNEIISDLEENEKRNKTSLGKLIDHYNVDCHTHILLNHNSIDLNEKDSIILVENDLVEFIYCKQPYNFERSKLSKLGKFSLIHILEDLLSPNEIIPIVDSSETMAEKVETYNSIIKLNKEIIDIFKKDFVKENKKTKAKKDENKEDSNSIVRYAALLNIFIPDDFIKICITDTGKNPCAVFTELLNPSNKNYFLGNKIKNDFSKNNVKIIKSFEEKLKNAFYSKKCFANTKILHMYLSQIRDKILQIGENCAFQKEVYNYFLEQKSYYKILSRVVLSVILLSNKQPGKSENYTFERYYHIKEPVIKPDPKAKENGVSESKATQYTKFYKKTFKSIWQPIESIDRTSINLRIRNYFYNNDYEKVYNICSSNSDYISKYEQLKHMYNLSNLLNFKLNVSAVEKDLEKENTGLAWYSLFSVYDGKYSDAYFDPIKRTKALNKAAELGEPNAIFIKAEELSKDISNNHNEIISLLSESNIDQMDNRQKSMAYYYRGLCFETEGNNTEAQSEFRKSLNFGNKSARQKIQRQPRKLSEFNRSFIENGNNICVVNSANENTKVLLRTLPNDYSVYSINCNFAKTEIDGIIDFSNITNCIGKILLQLNESDNKKIVIALLSNDDEVNLNQGLEILDRLFNITLGINDEKELTKFINLFDIYIKCSYDYASTFIDASISDMGDKIYFATHIVDPYRSSFHELLYNRPLFLPCFDGEKDINIAVCGYDNDFNLSTAKEIMAVGYLGKAPKINISMYSKDSALLDKMIETDLPGLKKSKQGKIRDIITPVSIKTGFSEYQLLKQLNENKKINYIIVNVGTDAENIAFAVKLRRHLLVNSDNLERKPFIAVYCKDPKTAFLAKRMTLSNVSSEENYYNNYDLYLFGSTEKLYSYDKLINNNLEKQALAIHLSYSGLSLYLEHNKETHKAYNSYYSYQYNQDSSINTAVCLRYRLFIAGCYEECSSNKLFSSEDDLSYATKYEEKAEVNLEDYAEIEQIRWNNFMISRGWAAPTTSQLIEYLQKSYISNHKYMLAKLHPYIANWEDLDDNGEICQIIDGAASIAFQSPQETTRGSVKGTAEFLRILGKTKGKETDREIER